MIFLTLRDCRFPHVAGGRFSHLRRGTVLGSAPGVFTRVTPNRCPFRIAHVFVHKNRLRKCGCHVLHHKAGTASLSSPLSTLLATDVGTKEMGLIESVSEDAEKSWLCMVADSVAIK